MVKLIDAFLSHFTANCMDWQSGETMQETTTKMEFAVNMTCHSCEKTVRESLQHIEGIESVDIDVSKQRVLIATTQPSNIIQDAIEKTGMLAVVRGQGANHMGAAVSIIKDKEIIKGLIRFTQVEEDKCVIDGSFNGLSPGKHGLHIHEYGDLSQGCISTGDDYNPNDASHGDRRNSNRHAGDLGNIDVDASGSSTLRYVDNLIKVWDVIGRSVVIHEKEDDLMCEDHGGAGKGIACGIIARSSGLFQNKKTVCSCTGKTLWEEREDFRSMLTP